MESTNFWVGFYREICPLELIEFGIGGFTAGLWIVGVFLGLGVCWLW